MPLGAQMAVVYVGINIFFSMALSAVISLFVLIAVQLNKVVKQGMGKLASRNIVTPLGSASHKVMDEEERNGKSTTEEVVTKGEKRVKWADIRKRRPSNAGNADLTFTGRNIVSSPADPAPQTPVDLDSSNPTSSFTWETTNRMVRNRQSRAKSSTRVVPDAVLSPAQNGLDKDPNQWAGISSWNVEDSSTHTREGRKTSSSSSDRVVTPSSCHINVPSPIYPTRPNLKTSAFANDMEAYDIW